MAEKSLITLSRAGFAGLLTLSLLGMAGIGYALGLTLNHSAPATAPRNNFV